MRTFTPFGNARFPKRIIRYQLFPIYYNVSRLEKIVSFKKHIKI